MGGEGEMRRVNGVRCGRRVGGYLKTLLSLHLLELHLHPLELTSRRNVPFQIVAAYCLWLLFRGFYRFSLFSFQIVRKIAPCTTVAVSLESGRDVKLWTDKEKRQTEIVLICKRLPTLAAPVSAKGLADTVARWRDLHQPSNNVRL